MTAMHPHWQSTDGEDVPVRVRSRDEGIKHAPTKQKARGVSRAPGAVAGIALMVLIGFALFSGAGSLLSQVANLQTPIRITHQGVIPTILEAKLGEEVIWSNETNIPRNLSFSTILTDQGIPLRSATIFPSETGSVLLPSSLAAGIYVYTSDTIPALSGSILISDPLIAATTIPASAASSQTFEVASEPTLNSFEPLPAQIPTPTPTPIPEADPFPFDQFENIGTVDGGVDGPSEAVSTIERNPHTVDSYEPVAASVTAATGIHPDKTAQTGPSLWFAALLSLGIFFVITRKHLVG